MKPGKMSGKWQAALGIALSLFFVLLAFRQVKLEQMLHALREADYWYLLPILGVTVLWLYLRSLRWRLLLAPIQPARTKVLFASLCIGYMANTFLPAHLGEFVRAWHASGRCGIVAGSVFATIVVERLLDIASLLLLLGAALLVFPFPGWVRQSGGVMLASVVVMGILLLLMKKNRARTLAVSGRLLRFLPAAPAARIRKLLEQFLCGVAPLKKRSRYLAVAGLTLLIWASYALTFQLLFHAFGFVDRYRLPAIAALVAMVITTISVVVPSSPGYIGTYHFLCQLSLGLFSVPRGPALSYAFVLHALSTLPFLFLGLFFLAREKLSFRSLRKGDAHAADR